MHFYLFIKIIITFFNGLQHMQIHKFLIGILFLIIHFILSLNSHQVVSLRS